MYEDILAVSIDDNEQNLMLLEAYAEQIDLKLKSFADSIEALEFIKTNNVDIIFVDYMMPKLNGLELIEEFRINNTETPIIMITAANDSKLKIDAFKIGATDFLNKPLDLVEFTLRTKNLLELRLAQLKLKDRAKQLEGEIQKATCDLIQREHESLVVLGKTAEWKDPETGSHIARVAHYSKLLAKKYGLDENMQDCIFYSAPFHDIGKIGIPDNILLKPGKLTNDEFTSMKEHASIGFDILKDSKSKYLLMGAKIALSHHEKFDGSGYPSRLKGDEIPIEGRIVAIADVFDALTSIRPYKRAWTFDESINLLKEEKNRHFDPAFVDLFIENIDEVKEIFNTFQESN